MQRSFATVCHSPIVRSSSFANHRPKPHCCTRDSGRRRRAPVARAPLPGGGWRRAASPRRSGRGGLRRARPASAGNFDLCVDGANALQHDHVVHRALRGCAAQPLVVPSARQGRAVDLLGTSAVRCGPGSQVCRPSGPSCHLAREPRPSVSQEGALQHPVPVHAP